LLITVLLAVYNGEKYLRQQIDSLLAQTIKEFKILIRDDGSSDSSSQIIDEYCAKFPQQISKICGKPTGSAAQNFAQLLNACDSDYIAFCDQDDVWLPQKLEKTLDAMKRTEAQGLNIPVLVHSDLKVVNQNLEVISPSFFKFQRLPQDRLTLSKLLVQNYITGCTVMINRALKDLCGKIPPECIMHDWWLALTASFFGKIVCVNESLILYRQHADNQVGAKAAYGIKLLKRKFTTRDTVKKNYDSTYVQAKALLDCYGSKIDKTQAQIVGVYASMKDKNKFQKLKLINKYGFKKSPILRLIGQYFLM